MRVDHPGQVAGGPPPSALAPRLALFFAMYFAAIGVLLPYWPVWLAAQGLDPDEIGLALALGLFARIVTVPFVARWADRKGKRRRVMTASALVGLLGYAGFAVTGGLPAILLLSLVTGAAMTTMLPLGEAMTMSHVAAGRIDYGRVRLWASIAFIGTASLAGAVLERSGSASVLWLTLGLVAVLVAACAAVPPSAPAPSEGRREARVAELLRADLLLFLLAAGLIQASHAVLYGFGTLHWQAQGLSDGLIGVLWALGVVAEVALFAFSGRLLSRPSPPQLLLAAGALTGLRWIVLAFATEPATIAAAQLLHAISFAVTHLAVMHHIQRTAPAALAGTAQAVYVAFMGGSLMGAATLASGWLYAQVAGLSYLAMAVMAWTGAAIALALIGRRRAPAPPS